MSKPLVGIVMGSSNDWNIMQHTARALKDFGVAYEARALSAHRTPDLLIEWIDIANEQDRPTWGIQVNMVRGQGKAFPFFNGSVQ